jgi:predicted Zn-dependent peptidase
MTALSEPAARSATLPNGAVVITERMPHLRSVCLGLWVRVGSRHEPAARAGVSHFIEHMLFKGTATRSAEEIARAIDAVGGTLDAFTSREQTCFYAKVLGEHLPLAVDLLADVLLHSRLDPADVDKERQVIRQEIELVEDTPDDLVHDLFAETIWGEHPLGRPVLGRRPTVEVLQREDLLGHLQTFYRPDRVVIAAAGDLEHERLLALLREALAGWRGTAARLDGAPPVARPGTVNLERDLSQVHLCLGVSGLSYAHRDRYALYLLNALLGGGMSSRLFQEVREKRGLAYSIYSYQASYQDAGLFVVYAGTAPESFAQVVDLIQAECRAVAARGVDPVELKRAKEQLKGNLLLGLESTSSRMTRLAKMCLYFGRCFDLDEIIQGIEAVTEERLAAVARALFGDQAFTLTSIGRPPARAAA